jgi:hypothetical protein
MQHDLPLLSTSAVAMATGVLAAITNAHALTKTERERLESAYKAIAEHLAEHDDFRHVTIEVHPQGSMLLGTTTRPEGKIEIDVDLVVLLVQRLHEQVDCSTLLSALFHAIKEHTDRYELGIKPKRRCVQIEYAGAMHADATPVVHCPHAYDRYGATYAVVPDRDLSRYIGTNPKGYRQWFSEAAAVTPMFTMYRAMAELTAKADVIPLPSLEVFDRLLSRIVQLFKIHRNICFANNTDFCPPSIFITTLIAHAYRRALQQTFTSPLDLILTIWQDMPTYIDRKLLGDGREKWVLDNPTATGDNLADRMNQGNRQQQFNAWHLRFREDFLELIAQANSQQGADALTARIKKSYGEKSTKGIATAMTQLAERQRAAQRIIIPSTTASGAGVAAAPSIGIASQTHRFFGRH